MKSHIYVKYNLIFIVCSVHLYKLDTTFSCMVVIAFFCKSLVYNNYRNRRKSLTIASIALSNLWIKTYYIPRNFEKGYALLYLKKVMLILQMAPDKFIDISFLP